MNSTEKQHQSQQLMRNFTWLSLQEMLIRVIGLATAIYLARVLSPAIYGALGLALAIVGVLQTLVQAGTGSRATRLTALNPDSVPETYAEITGLRLSVAVVVIVILVLSAPVLSGVFSFPASLLILCSFLLLRQAFAVIWAFRGLDRMHVPAMADVTEKAVVFAGLLVLVKGQANDYLWIPVLEVSAALVMVWWLRKRLSLIYPNLAIEFRFREWPEVTRESLPLGLAALLGSVYFHGAILMLGWLDTSESAANFLVAQKMMLTMGILIHVINQAAFPSTSRLLSTGTKQALDLLSSLLRYYLVLITPMILILAWYADEVLALLFGAVYTNAGPVLIVLLAALPFVAISNSLQQLLRSIPRPGDSLLARIASTLALVVMCLVLIPRYGVTGAGLAVVVSEAMGMSLLFWLVKRALGAVPWTARCLMPLPAGLIAVLVFVQLKDSSEWLAMILSVLVYALAAWLMKAVSSDELKSLPALLTGLLRKNT
jgi:O-antigen/teichoic acid export membrane protein